MKLAELEAIRAYIDAAAELAAINALKARPIITSLEVTSDVEDIVGKVLARLPAPKDPEPVDRAAIVQEVLALVPVPENGKDAEPIDRDALIADVVALIPVPKDGEPGKDAVVDVDTIARQAAALIPVPKDGRDAPPVDMVALAKDVLALIPVPRDGRDGIASRDELLAAVNAKVAEAIGPAVQTAVDAYAASLPKVEYRGVFQEGTTYDRGNFVTWAGSLWSANEATADKPGEGSKAWTLAVKRGRDGRDAK